MKHAEHLATDQRGHERQHDSDNDVGVVDDLGERQHVVIVVHLGHVERMADDDVPELHAAIHGRLASLDGPERQRAHSAAIR